jgi:hypothetical protein
MQPFQWATKIESLIESAKKAENSTQQLNIVTELAGKAKTVVTIVITHVGRSLLMCDTRGFLI